MPVLSPHLLSSHRELRLAHLALGFISMGYVWQEGQHAPAQVKHYCSKEKDGKRSIHWWPGSLRFEKQIKIYNLAVVRDLKAALSCRICIIDKLLTKNKQKKYF